MIYFKFDAHKLDDFDLFEHVSEQKKCSLIDDITIVTNKDDRYI
jgi:hypothetical protein